MQKFFIDQEKPQFLANKYDVESPLKRERFSDKPMWDNHKFTVFGHRESVKWHNVFQGHLNGLKPNQRSQSAVPGQRKEVDIKPYSRPQYSGEIKESNLDLSPWQKKKAFQISQNRKPSQESEQRSVSMNMKKGIFIRNNNIQKNVIDAFGNQINQKQNGRSKREQELEDYHLNNGYTQNNDQVDKNDGLLNDIKVGFQSYDKDSDINKRNIQQSTQFKNSALYQKARCQTANNRRSSQLLDGEQNGNQNNNYDLKNDLENDAASSSQIPKLFRPREYNKYMMLHGNLRPGNYQNKSLADTQKTLNRTFEKYNPVVESRLNQSMDQRYNRSESRRRHNCFDKNLGLTRFNLQQNPVLQTLSKEKQTLRQIHAKNPILRKGIETLQQQDLLKLKRRRQILIKHRSKPYCYNDYHDRRSNPGYSRQELYGTFYNR